MASSGLAAPVSEADVALIIDGVVSFVRRFVQPLHDRNTALLEDPRAAYDTDGRPAPAVAELRRRTRTAAAEAGYYTLFAPEELGGGGQGAVMSFLLYETLFREFGPGRILIEDVVGKWNRGPSGLIRYFSDALRHEISGDLMSGRTTFCFALSEPDAGSDAWALTTRAVRVAGGAEYVLLPRLPNELEPPRRASAMAGASNRATAAVVARRREPLPDIGFVTLLLKRL